MYREWKRFVLLMVFGLPAACSVAGCSDRSSELQEPPASESGGPQGAAADSSPAAQGDGGEPGAGHAHGDAHSGSAALKPAAGGDAPELLAGWPRPTVLFAVTGQMHGYLEPCGCSEPQYGGISRRAALLEQLRERGWDPIPLDLGGTLKRSRQQSQFKFQTLLTGLRKMKYQVLALGEEELRLDGGLLLSQHVTDPNDPAGILSFVSANVVLFDSPEIGTPIPYKIVETGDRRIGITAVIEPAVAERIGGLADAGISVTDLEPALQSVKSELEKQKVDLLVLLSHCRLETSRRLAEQHPEFQLIFSTGPVEEPYADNPVRLGNTTLMAVGHKGKHVGVAGWYPDSADNPVRFRMVRLDGERFTDPPEMLQLMRNYQDLLRDTNLAETEPALPHRSGDTYIGSERCGECHTQAFAKWKTTRHAHAFDSLRTGRRGIPRVYDPECITCHVTGWDPQEVFRYQSGYLNEKSTGHLLHVGCESCHGPGSGHVEKIENDEIETARMLMRVTRAQAQNSLCNQCHDLDNSPHFDFDSYWEQVAHPGLD